jgi:hypothetical protein
MKEPIFTKEAVMKILAGQEEDGQKVDALFALYNEDLNGLKMNRDDLKSEKEKVEGKLAEATAQNAKIAEDFAALQKQLESSSPDEIKKACEKAYEQKQTELESSYRGLLEKKDTTIKELTENLEKSQKTEHYLKCIQDFNKAAEGYDIEPTGRDFLFEAIYGQDGTKFIERDLGEGMKLYNADGQTGVAAAKAFFNTDLGKKFIRNISSGGSAGAGSSAGNQPIVNPFKKETFNLTEQARLLKENPELYKQMKAAAGA